MMTVLFAQRKLYYVSPGKQASTNKIDIAVHHGFVSFAGEIFYPSGTTQRTRVE